MCPHGVVIWACILSGATCCVFTDSSFSNISLFSLSPFPPHCSVCIDPFTSPDAVDDSIPNLNPFLTLPVVAAVHLPVVSPDAVSLSSRTPIHEVFGGKHSLPLVFHCVFVCVVVVPLFVLGICASCQMCPVHHYTRPSCKCVCGGGNCTVENQLTRRFN